MEKFPWGGGESFAVTLKAKNKAIVRSYTLESSSTDTKMMFLQHTDKSEAAPFIS
jgi:hypothetical protein